MYSFFTVECDKLKNVANVEAGKEKKTKANKHYPGYNNNSHYDQAGYQMSGPAGEFATKVLMGSVSPAPVLQEEEKQNDNNNGDAEENTVPKLSVTQQPMDDSL